jgi:DNA-binding protein H-NS
MISAATLNELRDDELRAFISQADGILKQRDDERKARAIVDARAVQAKALNDAKAVLEAAGLSLKDLGGNGKKKATKGPVYHAGHAYQHPADKTLVWNGKGKKPRWLVELESEGEKALEILAANDNVPAAGAQVGQR